MEKRFYFSFLVIICFNLIFSACSNSDDDGDVNDNSEQITQVENTVESGTWRITNFIDSGENETSDFTGYNFSFNSDGSLVATNGTDTLTGTWSVTDDSSGSDDDIDFNIFFPVPDTNDFEDLNDDWDIISYTSTRIELIDISGGNGGTDNLTFEKN
ncbi:hypothetical protein [Lutimonas zeaxanthinifaciens]|uniref:hypothetical protein n=1 Tax=Lutimonas zeaxanthinifaciens TaxID=3060215 RepID=UPI00265CD648|nr:hypothetical protein [Lutimonas sp. YSD2104]WKK67027.1 hypothetical protein QZH61_05245 [Lutimonas sp. YSD2104]